MGWYVVKWPVTKLLFHFVGMGLDEFSMSATSVLRTRSLMKKLDTAKMEEYANRALTECSTMEEVLELSKEYVNVD